MADANREFPAEYFAETRETEAIPAEGGSSASTASLGLGRCAAAETTKDVVAVAHYLVPREAVLAALTTMGLLRGLGEENICD